MCKQTAPRALLVTLAAAALLAATPAAAFTVDQGQLAVATSAALAAAGRKQACCVALNDDTVVCMGGTTAIDASGVQDDVWRSNADGTVWSQVTVSGSLWSPRLGASCVHVDVDDSIVLIGGLGAGDTAFDDVWRSTDGGATWTQTGTTPWTPRMYAAAVSFPSTETIVYMGGGVDGSDDVYMSTDKGVTWNSVAATGTRWSARHSLAAVPGGSSGEIFVVGGKVSSAVDAGSPVVRDVWKTTDFGASWTQANAEIWSATGSTGRGLQLVRLSDGTLVTLGGYGTLQGYASTDGGVTWAAAGAMPAAAADSGSSLWLHSAVTLSDDQVWVMFGTNDNQDSFSNVVSTMSVDADSACPSDYGLDCTCATAVPATAEVDIVTLALAADPSTGDLTLTAGGAHALAGRTVTKTELSARTTGGGTCTKVLLRTAFDCSASAGCGDCTSFLTLDSLQAHCGEELEAEIMDGSTVLRIDATLYYEDALTDLLGFVLGTAEHQADATIYIAVGSGQTNVRGANVGAVTFFDAQVSGTSITPATDDADTDAEMAVKVLVTVNKDVVVGSTAPVVAKTPPAPTFTEVTVSAEPTQLGCTSTRCSYEVVVQLKSSVAACDFTGAFTLTITLDGEASDVDVAISGVAGTDACRAKTVGEVGTPVGVVGSAATASTGILGSSGGMLTLSWTSSVQLQDGAGQPDGTDIESELTEVHMELQPTSGAGSTCDTSVAGVKVFSAAESVLVLVKASDGTNMVTVSAVNADRDTVTLDIATADLAQLAQIDTSGNNAQFASLSATFEAQVCVVVSRTAQVGVTLPTRRLQSARAVPVRRLEPTQGRATPNAEVVPADGAGTAGVIVAAPGDDTSISASLRLQTSRNLLLGGLDDVTRDALARAVNRQVALYLHVGQRTVHIDSVVPTVDGNTVDVSFTLVLSGTYNPAAVHKTLQSAMDTLSTSPTNSRLAAAVNGELLSNRATSTFEALSGRTSRAVHGQQDPGTSGADVATILVKPWVLAAAGAVVVVFAAAGVAWLHGRQASPHVTKVKTITIKVKPGSQERPQQTRRAPSAAVEGCSNLKAFELLNNSSGSVQSQAWTPVRPGSLHPNPNACTGSSDRSSVAGSGFLI